jgi:alkanesulfonate monooxygenase SsuD/methylene tetrahydromethanopterin reductase-like flavin-dependent oxidoreductase (luciferase family)
VPEKKGEVVGEAVDVTLVVEVALADVVNEGAREEVDAGDAEFERDEEAEAVALRVPVTVGDEDNDAEFDAEPLKVGDCVAVTVTDPLPMAPSEGVGGLLTDVVARIVDEVVEDTVPDTECVCVTLAVNVALPEGDTDCDTDLEFVIVTDREAVNEPE